MVKDRDGRLVTTRTIAEVFTNLTILLRLLDHGFEVLEFRHAVSESVGDHFRAVRETSATEGDEAVGRFGAHVVDYGDEVVPWGVWADAGPCCNVVGSEGDFEVFDVRCLA